MKEKIDAILSEIEKVIIGKNEIESSTAPAAKAKTTVVNQSRRIEKTCTADNSNGKPMPANFGNISSSAPQTISTSREKTIWTVLFRTADENVLQSRIID